MNSYEHRLRHLVIYQKSIDIFKLSRQIAAYITNDKKIISMYLSDTESDKFADDLVMDSMGLVPKIAETEIQENPKTKLRYAKSLRIFIDRLYSHCLKLENTKIQGKDFVKLLRKELKSFRKIHKHYVNSIL